eukprot:CAMPEP_0172663458 /NCGR_PEP_ID=MMETSP1074-20121228/5940_1 /TAXON_ID=2916 /ORGANISM="Ceratium fusus, Strain PA161109" /LENGTH=467 /DNA_ID=CAMNT_0013479461 /DNA_START=58 /DNA_END=1458 /DNA_ORIENTATION=-
MAAAKRRARLSALGADRKQLCERGSNARAPSAAKAQSAVALEEERVNSQLVEILERKCAKLRQRAEAEEQCRRATDAKLLEADLRLAADTAKLQQQRRRLEVHEHEQAAACARASEEGVLAAEHAAALQTESVDCRDARHELGQRALEVQQMREEAEKGETAWQQQILKLIAEVQAAQAHAGDLEVRATEATQERIKLQEHSQELMQRFEEESARRLDLEDQCLSLEERLRSKGAVEKAKLSAQERQRVEDITRQREHRSRQARRRAEDAEQHCERLEEELQKMKALCADRQRRFEVFDRHEQAAQASLTVQTPGSLPRLQVPKPRSARLLHLGDGSCSSRSGSGSAAVDVTQVQRRTGATIGATPSPMHSRPVAVATTGKPVPGAIRRAGSVPAHPKTAMLVAAKSLGNGASGTPRQQQRQPQQQQSQQPQRQQQPVEQRHPESAPSSCRHSSDIDIDHRLPSEPD